MYLTTKNKIWLFSNIQLIYIISKLIYGLKKYNSTKAYCDSKLSNALFSLELSSRLNANNATFKNLYIIMVNSNFASGTWGVISIFLKMYKSIWIVNLK